jgi:predicted phosphohydrolase
MYAAFCNYDLLDVLYRNGVKQCFYGHIHGERAFEYAINGERDGVEHFLVSSDYLQFRAKRVL